MADNPPPIQDHPEIPVGRTIERGPMDTQPINSEWELEVREILAQMEEVLGGYYNVRVWNEETKEYDRIERRRDPKIALLNDNGLRYVNSRILMVANKWSALSQQDELMVRKFTLSYADSIRRELRSRHDEFGVKLYNFESLVLAIAQFIFLAQSKSLEGGERTYRRGIVTRVTETIGAVKRGVMDNLTGIFRNSGGSGT